MRCLRLLPLAAALLVGAARPAVAQKVIGWSYDWAMPMGDMKDYIENDSWLGFGLDLRTFTSENVSFGLSVSYSEFYDEHDGPHPAAERGDFRATVSSPVRRAAHAQRLLCTAATRDTAPGHTSGSTRARTTSTKSSTSARSSPTTDNWIFGVAPEVGLLLPVRGTVGTVLHVRYNYPISAGSFLSREARSFQYLSVGIGFYSRRR